MKYSSRRHGVGTLLIIVLVVLASFFIMAMMQYFASTVTKGKRILAHIAVTDYACEAALDEAVLWFKGHANDPQDQDAMKLHKELVKTGNGKAATTKKPDETIKLFKSLYRDYLAINDVDITVSNVSKIGHTGKLGKNPFCETQGIVNFAVTAKYETTKKTAVRSLEFRQVVCAPPQDFANFQFVATDFGYLKRRVAKYIYDQSKLQNALAMVAAKVYFGFSMLTYIVDPGNQAVGGGQNFMVGLNFIKQVKAAAQKMSSNGWNDPAVADKLKRGMCPTCNPPQDDGLDKWANTYKNPNFNIQYVDAMANADTSNLTKVLDEMKQSDFGFNPGQGGQLSGGDGYPLSAPGPDGKPVESTASVLGNGSGYGFKPAQKWGFPGEMKGEMFQKAKLEFQGESGTMSLEQVAAKMSLSPDGQFSESGALGVVVPARPSDKEFSLHGLEFFIHPPPCLPSVDDKTSDALQGDQGVEGIDAQCKMTDDDLKRMDQSGGDGKLMAELAEGGGNWGDKFKDLQTTPDAPGGKLDKKDYRLPGLSLWHPKSYEDWAFRMPVKFWKQNFKDHYDAFHSWKDKTLAAAKYYKETMEQSNKNLKEFMIRDGSQSGMSGQQIAQQSVPVEKTKLYERASYVFDTTKDFDEAMKGLSDANGNPAQLVMNGVYYIGPKEEAPANGQTTTTPQSTTGQSGTNVGPLEIKQAEYVGQGEIVATDALVLKKGLACKSKDRDVPMVLYSASEKPFDLQATDPIQASIIVNSILKSSAAAHINGVFVVKDAVCAAAASESGATDNSAKLELDQVQHYYRSLPDIKIKHPEYDKKDPVFYSQITFSPYRTSSGGARMAR